MDNQHQQIKGYRDLSQGEIDMMNEVKALAQRVEGYVAMVQSHLRTQETEAPDDAERARIAAAQPARWASIARTDFQTGFMALVRAIAQPTTF